MKVIVTGMIGTFPLGGVACDYCQYAVGLERLGLEVYYLAMNHYVGIDAFLEASSVWFVGQVQNAVGELAVPLGFKRSKRAQNCSSKMRSLAVHYVVFPKTAAIAAIKPVIIHKTAVIKVASTVAALAKTSSMAKSIPTINSSRVASRVAMSPLGLRAVSNSLYVFKASLNAS
jgi:hypothetical protein